MMWPSGCNLVILTSVIMALLTNLEYYNGFAWVEGSYVYIGTV